MVLPSCGLSSTPALCREAILVEKRVIMRIGIQLVFQGHKDYADREMYKQELRLAIDAEAMGYDILWPVEHHFFDYSICPDNMKYLSYIAARTERIELATGAIILPWNNPMRVVEKIPTCP